MNLAQIFAAVAHKRLAGVDLPDAGSNQHELNGSGPLREFFGTAGETRGSISWHYFADDSEPANVENSFTFYDARAKSAARTNRSEWRFYYYGDFLKRAEEGDLLVIARTQSGKLFGLVFQRASSWHRAAEIFFGLSRSQSEFQQLTEQALSEQQLELLRQQILHELELDITLPSSRTDEEIILEKFGNSFPKTREMSDFARSQTQIDAGNPDLALTKWLEREEQLFRALENTIIRERLKIGFRTVDEFIEYSLSVQNRRKSRMGFALQNHLHEIFTRERLRFTPQPRTEARNKPDFIFPSEADYHNAQFDASLLVMLGVKSTTKDRWRQVLTEADRILKKHLCTLEAGISDRPRFGRKLFEKCRVTKKMLVEDLIDSLRHPDVVEITKKLNAEKGRSANKRNPLLIEQLESAIITKRRNVARACIPILVEVTASCDYAQMKQRAARLVGGLLVPNDDIVPTAEHKRLIEPVDFHEANARISGIYSLVLGAHFIFGIPKQKLYAIPIARLRNSVLVDIQSWLGAQVARPGYTSVCDVQKVRVPATKAPASTVGSQTLVVEATSAPLNTALHTVAVLPSDQPKAPQS